MDGIDEVVEALEKIRLPVTDTERYRAYIFEKEIAPRLKLGRFEGRYIHDERPWNNAIQERVFNDCKAKLSACGAIVALVGNRGLGKTTIAGQIAVDRAWAWWNWHGVTPDERERLTPPIGIPEYRKLNDLIAEYKPLYGDFGSINAEQLIERRKRLCQNETLLVIDELHDCEDMKMKERVLTDFCDRRYAANTDTLIISNQTPEEFAITTSDSILSRISEHGEVIYCKWESWREKAQS